MTTPNEDHVDTFTDRYTDDDETDVNSVDEAMMEMLGITSFDEIGEDDILRKYNTNNGNSSSQQTSSHVHEAPKIKSSIPIMTIKEMEHVVKLDYLKNTYRQESICIFPEEFSIPSKTMRRITDELIYGSTKYQSERSNESIQFIKHGAMGSRSVLTRLENFVVNHSEWKDLCYNHIAKCISALMEEEMILFKEKLNLKPPGGSGFAPHLDSPSLRVALGDEGPQTFVTVMVAIDDMTESNGCLKVCKGGWSEQKHSEIIEPKDKDSNPDAEGRRGAIPADVANQQHYENISVKGGTITAFNGWAPHRSKSNTSAFPRRAIFLTYNPLHEGDFHELYYQKMNSLRSTYKRRTLNDDIDETEIAALSTIPRI